MEKDYQHPQYAPDRQLLNQLLTQVHRDPVPELVVVEIARLRIRYMGFPGARDIQRDLDQVLQTWGITEAELFRRSRAIHAQGRVYQETFSKRDDWA
ncbi:MAG: DUF3288 family protein [Thermostichales cyanobacterium DRC_bins_46]